jgi:hypothetical protein
MMLVGCDRHAGLARQQAFPQEIARRADVLLVAAEKVNDVRRVAHGAGGNEPLIPVL